MLIAQADQGRRACKATVASGQPAVSSSGAGGVCRQPGFRRIPAAAAAPPGSVGPATAVPPASGCCTAAARDVSYVHDHSMCLGPCIAHCDAAQDSSTGRAYAAAVVQPLSPRNEALRVCCTQIQGYGVEDAEDERKAEEQQLQQQLAALSFKRTLRTLAVLQDVADAALAANDLRGDVSMAAGS